MIIYELECKNNHRFEGWFKARQAFEEQKKDRQIICPVCGDADILLAPSPVAIGGRQPASHSREIKEGRESLKIIRYIREYLNKNFDDVGERFADVALKMHRGEEEARNIKGMTTEGEEETLKEEGVQFIKIRLLKYDG
ncbi:MAG: DUF1178 family protein [Syntrophobacterales bacterium]|nr:DUF1178 family protein [Syntrophobacterales bacterium]